MTVIPPDQVAQEREKFYASVPKNQRPTEDGRYRDPFMKDADGNAYFNEWTAGHYNTEPGARHAEDPNNFKVVPQFYDKLSRKYYKTITKDLKKLQRGGFDNVKKMIAQAYGKLD